MVWYCSDISVFHAEQNDLDLMIQQDICATCTLLIGICACNIERNTYYKDTN